MGREGAGGEWESFLRLSCRKIMLRVVGGEKVEEE